MSQKSIASWIKLHKPIFIIGLIILVGGLLVIFARPNSSSQPDSSLSNSEQTDEAAVDDSEIEDLPEVNVDTAEDDRTANTSTLTHNQLVSNSSSSSFIGSTYEMKLYLEQAPTSTDAYFMTLSDPNNAENILILCSMGSADLDKLDGASSQSGNYGSYNLEVSFETFDSNLNIYTASCSLI